MTDSDLDRFFARISPEPNSGCWLWTGALDQGYGVFDAKGHSRRAHRAVYEALVGPVGDDTLDHLCRVRSCVNPAHLEPVSHVENIMRGESFTAKRARQTHCKNGHELTASNVYAKAGKWRACRACQRDYAQAFRDRRRSA